MPKKDLNQLAKSIVDQAVGEEAKYMDARRAASRKGGLVGGQKRMESMTEAERKALSAKGVAARKKAPAGEAGAGLVKK